MNDIEQHALWDEFLATWPISRLQKMKLDDYTKAGAKNTFTYWLESRLDKMGSIWGGDSFKFGVYSRKDTAEKTSDNKFSWSDTHGWRTSLGASAEEAFENVRQNIVHIATLAECGDLAGIQAFDRLGEKFKWKIAFHYQDRSNPLIVSVFTKDNLAKYVGDSTKKSMAELQSIVMNKRPRSMDILKYGKLVWEGNSQEIQLEIWKLSHGVGFSENEREQYLKDQLAVMHGETGIGQGNQFGTQISIGTLFYLCHGNRPRLVGQFTTNATPCKKDGNDGWLKRSYRVIQHAVHWHPFWEHSKKWSPRGNSTFWKVGESDLLEFEDMVLKPYFGIDLSELARRAEREIIPNEELTPPKHNEISVEVEQCINQIYYGPPGTGKTFELTRFLKSKYGYGSNEERCSFVTFHQSFGYEEFVEGLRPRLDNAEEGNGAAGIKYEIRSGAFKLLCARARSEKGQRFAIVIDEINRGNISKIFGELITLIEPDKREGGDSEVTVTLPYSGDKFSVPPNIDIFGTMNTADRSLATLDTALRRRFEFLPFRPDSTDEKGHPLFNLRVNVDETEISIPAMLYMINQRIETLYDQDHCIGHAYFMSLDKMDDGEARFSALGDIFKTRILPLLEEYFFEDWEKIRLVLADNQKPTKFQFVIEGEPEKDHEEKLYQMFGENYATDTYATKKGFRIQKSAFEHPDSYIGIYSKVRS